MSTSPLGIRTFGSDDDEGPDDVMSMFQDEEPGDETPPAQLAPEDVPEEAPGELAPSDEPEEAPEETEEPEETPEETPAADHLYANKYRSPEELERAYLEVTTGFTRVAQENAQIRQFQEQQAQQFQAQQEQMAQVVQYLQAQMAEQDPEFAAELEKRMETQQLIDQQVAQRVAPIEERLQANDPQQVQAVARMQSAANDFYQRHTDVAQGSPEDVAMVQGIVQMMNAGVPIDLASAEHLDLALEASKNDALAAELMMAPQALQVPGGIDVLRQRAGARLTTSEAPPAENGTRAKGPVRQRVETFVETGTGGAPQSGAPGRTPDEFDQAWSEYQKRSSKGPLFGGAG